MQNILKRIELEQRLEVLNIVKEQAINDELYITTNKGAYKLKFDARMLIINNIEESTKLIKERLEEITGLNYDKLERLNRVGK